MEWLSIKCCMHSFYIFIMFKILSLLPEYVTGLYTMKRTYLACNEMVCIISGLELLCNFLFLALCLYGYNFAS